MLYFALLAIATSVGLGIAAFGCGIGAGNAISGALAGMARQPELTGKLQVTMIIGLAIIESLTIYCLVIAFMLFAKLPATDQMLGLIK
ncbi:MAG: ATP synthase F0 subunit C [Nitrospinota bacterium]|jgi:F-type H+-transporting ATPase subunit c|nr:ATP synthase F0 subunit C [Nitrospinota bacterium]MDP7350947.1 ATP synthase F0 subunit C [Nitrospinota bacterium]MDP7554895.1 ATP synthase F0 subunit C [Nitrospinota bacterium]MDP7581448.1 ATP synthase F0 subunit C [Nitrospinota bacterium]HJN03275.1 ATP synthase F0 subunit C [Nitrospinota bacterium]